MIITGILLFLAVIPLHWLKSVFRGPAKHDDAWYGLPASFMFMVVSFTSLMCYLAGPLLFCLGLWQILIGGV